MKIIWIVCFFLLSLFHSRAYARHEIGTQYFDVYLGDIHQLVDVQPNDALVFVDDIKSRSFIPSTLIIPKMTRPVILVITHKFRDIGDIHLKVHPKTHIRAIIVDKQTGNIVGSHAPIYRLSAYNPYKWYISGKETSYNIFPKCTCYKREYPMIIHHLLLHIIYEKYEFACSHNEIENKDSNFIKYFKIPIDQLNIFSQELFHRDFNFFVSFSNDINTIKLSSKHTSAYHQKQVKQLISKASKQKAICERRKVNPPQKTHLYNVIINH